MYRIIKLIILFFVFLVFVYKAFVFLDPDFGWHYRMGEIVTSIGVPKTDPFSYTMSSFHFVDHEWLTNTLIYFFYNKMGMVGLSIIFTLVAFTAISLSGKGNILLFLLSTASVLPFFGVRPQVQSWLYLSLLFLLIRKQNLWKKFRFLVPFFIIFWANMHGSYAVGVAVLLVFFLTRSIRLESILMADILIVTVSTLATLINPYGFGIWREAWMQFTDTNLRWSINEWMPAVFSFNLPFMAMIALSGVFLWIYRRKIVLEKKVLYLVFLFQALSSVRHVPLWVVIAMPITIEAMNYFIEDLRNIKLGQVRLRKVLKFSIAGGLAIFLLQAFFALRGAESFNEDTFYPREAIYYLKQNGVCGRVFNDYGWGGYLIWKMPEAKVFIDGRMPSWRWNVSVPKEANWAMKEYSGVLSGDMGFERVFDKYGIGTVLVPVDKKESLYSVLARKIDSILFKKEEPFKLKEELTDKGFKEVYKDNVAVVFKASDCSLRI